eukprot:2598361-Rhodomonas_salina.4
MQPVQTKTTIYQLRHCYSHSAERLLEFALLTWPESIVGLRIFKLLLSHSSQPWQRSLKSNVFWRHLSRRVVNSCEAHRQVSSGCSRIEAARANLRFALFHQRSSNPHFTP